MIRPDDLSFCSQNSIKQAYFEVPLLLISKLERAFVRENQTHVFELICKDGRIIKIVFSSQVHTEVNVFYLLFCQVFPKKITDCFAFKHSFSCDFNGWDIFDVRSDLRRVGVVDDDASVIARQAWQFIDNSAGQVCSSYPPWIVLPKLLSMAEIHASANFRKYNRLPTLIWVNPSNHASIWRASQPKITLTQPGALTPRCIEDEKVIQYIADSSRTSKLLIIDARPPLSQPNRSSGSFEPMTKHKSAELKLLSIPNFATVRESHNTMLFTANSVPTSRYLSTVEASCWLEYIAAILIGVSTAIEKLDEGESVLLNCSEGWDKTVQLSSLTQMCMDPYYRTLQGFCCLIEKDWCQFGHQFSMRCGHAAAFSEDRSPIFVQFLDCVMQLLRQFPLHFEFNERLLLELSQLVYSCRFGTFLCDSYQERLHLQVFSKTNSVWSYVLSRGKSFTNPFYRPDNYEVLYPNVSLRRMHIWKEYFSKWNRELYFSYSELSSQRDLEEELMNYAIEGVELYKAKLMEKLQEMAKSD